MSIQKKLFNSRHLWINPRPVLKAMPPPAQVFMKIFTWIRKRLLVIFLFTIMTMVVIGFLVPKELSTLSVYDEYNITDKASQPEGVFWEVLWWWRGQPAGWQTPSYGIFAVKNMDGNGFNGPLTYLGLLTEFVVDFTIYVPHYLDIGFVTTHLDTVPGFVIKVVLDVGAMAVFIMAVVPLIGVLFFFGPLIIQRLWLVAGPLLRIGIIAGFLLFVYLLFSGQLDPIFQGLIGFLGGR